MGLNIGIIGGGIMGCTLGYRLSQRGYKVHILESGPQVGGLSTWFQFDSFVWDKYYHVILKTDNEILDLIEDLGLSDLLYWANTKTGFLWEGKHHSMSSHWEFLTFPPLSIYQRFRLGFGILYNNTISDPSKISHMTAREYLTKICGKSVYDIIWDPLLESKFGTLKDEIPSTIIWSVMRRYSSTRDKSGGKEWMGHLRGGGLKVLFEAMLKKILDAGGSVLYNQKVQKIDYKGDSPITVHCQDGAFTFDKLISTIPTAHLQAIAPDLTPLYPNSPKPRFLGVIRLALVLKKALSPFYVTNLIDRGAPFTGIIEVSCLGEPEEFKDHHFVMIPRYDIAASPWFSKSDEEIKELFLQQLKKTWPDIEDLIVYSVVHRERVVMALWIDTPPPRDKASSTPDRRIWNVNNELSGYSTLNNNSVIEVANKFLKVWS